MVSSRAKCRCWTMWSLISFSQFLGSAFLYARLIIWQSLFKGCQRCHGRGRHSSLSWAISGERLQRMSQGWVSWASLAPITTACLSLAEPGHMCAAEQGDPSGHGLRSREGQFFRENLEGIFKITRMGCWIGRDTWCLLYFQPLYIAELLCFAPHTHERSYGSCIWLTSFKALPCSGPWASCGGFSPFRSGTYSSGLGHWIMLPWSQWIGQGWLSGPGRANKVKSDFHSNWSERDPFFQN